MKHFSQLLYLGKWLSNDRAVAQGLRHEVKDGEHSRFMPEDIISNALGAYLGEHLRTVNGGVLKPKMLIEQIQQLLNKCKPVNWSKLTDQDRKLILDHYIFERHKGANRVKYFGPPTDLLKSCTLCKDQGVSHPFKLTSTWYWEFNGIGFSARSYPNSQIVE